MTHVAVRETDEVLPHASLALNVLVCARDHPSLLTAPSLCDIVTAPQASDAVAPPNEPVGSAGLQPRLTFA